MFLPPLLSPFVLGLAKHLLPWLCRVHAGGLEVAISESDLARLRALKRQRLLLLPNHPTHFDPMVMIEVSRRLEEDFLFVAAREVFDRAWGLNGFLLQRCGVYSVVRGAVDRESFATTQRILVDGKHWLVIFIEGEVSMENDTVIPFEAGVASLALRAQDALSESSATASAPIHVATVAMKTTYKPGVEHAIASALALLESRVGLAPHPHFSSWPETRARIGAIGLKVLESVERAYLLSPPKNATLSDRIKAFKDRVLAKMETFLELTPPKGGTTLDRVRAVRNRMDRIVSAYVDEDESKSPYDRKLLKLRQQAFLDFYDDLTRVVNFLTIRGDYLEHASPERFAEVVIRLEQEILGKPRLVFPRTVHVSIGQIHDLRTHLSAYRDDKRKTSAALADSLESEMAALLTPRPSPPA